MLYSVAHFKSAQISCAMFYFGSTDFLFLICSSLRAHWATGHEQLPLYPAATHYFLYLHTTDDHAVCLDAPASLIILMIFVMDSMDIITTVTIIISSSSIIDMVILAFALALVHLHYQCYKYHHHCIMIISVAVLSLLPLLLLPIIISVIIKTIIITP